MPPPPTVDHPRPRLARWVRSGSTRSASGSSSSRGVVPSTATRARQRAARAARSPATASSTTTQSAGSTPSRRAPSSHGSGHGFPRSVSDAVTSAAGRVEPGGGDAGLGEVGRAGGDDGRGHRAVGERGEQVDGTGQQRRCRRRRPPRSRGSARTPRTRRLLGEQLGDDVRRAVTPWKPASRTGSTPYSSHHRSQDRTTAGIESMRVPSRSSSTPPNGAPNGARVRGGGRDGGDRHAAQPRHRPRGGRMTRPTGRPRTAVLSATLAVLALVGGWTWAAAASRAASTPGASRSARSRHRRPRTAGS